jgi:probable HAF family extracellular repeat protein
VRRERSSCGGFVRKKLFLFVLVALAVSPCLAQYNFKVVDFPGATQTNIFAIDDLGKYVGAWYDSNANGHAMYFDGKTLATLDPNGPIGTAPQSYAYSLNNVGQISGGFIGPDNNYHGFIYRNGKITQVDFPGGNNTQAYGVNDLGDVIGVYQDSNSQYHAFTLINGHYKNADLPGGLLTVPFSVSDRQIVVGQYANVAHTIGHGFFEIPGGKFTLYDAPGAQANSTYFISVNFWNQILGTYETPSNDFQNFLLVNGKLKLFNLPDSFQASFVSAQTINDWGVIVGYYNDANGLGHGFIAQPE